MKGSEKIMSQNQFNQKDKRGIPEHFTPKYGDPIAFGYTADIYRSGDRVLKVFSPEISKELVFREAYAMACIECAGINSPAVLAAYQEGGFWVVESEFINGVDMLSKIFEASVRGDVATVQDLIRHMAQLQAAIDHTSAKGLPSYKSYAADSIQVNKHLSQETIKKTLSLLQQLPNGDGICHGDFHPQNVLLLENGQSPYVIDWVEAGTAAPSCDPARTYMNLCHLPPVPPLMNPDLHMAEVYLDAYTSASGLTKDEILSWLPIHAAISYGEKEDWFNKQIAAYLL